MQWTKRPKCPPPSLTTHHSAALEQPVHQKKVTRKRGAVTACLPHHCAGIMARIETNLKLRTGWQKLWLSMNNATYPTKVTLAVSYIINSSSSNKNKNKNKNKDKDKDTDDNNNNNNNNQPNYQTSNKTQQQIKTTKQNATTNQSTNRPNNQTKHSADSTRTIRAMMTATTNITSARRFSPHTVYWKSPHTVAQRSQKSPRKNRKSTHKGESSWHSGTNKLLIQ